MPARTPSAPHARPATLLASSRPYTEPRKQRKRPLRHVHGLVTGEPADPGNFRRRVQRLLDEKILEQAPGKRITSSKPALVYRFTTRRR